MVGKRAFTLLELILVIVVIAILASLATPNFLESSERARRSRLRADIRAGLISPGHGFTTEKYDHIEDNGFADPRVRPLSTFSVDVDTASYSNVRRFLKAGELPPAGAVRVEEMVNYFTYDYPQPEEGSDLVVVADIGLCPWNPAHRLARVAVKAREVAWESRPPCNLVFLIDVSGSMADPNKLPLVKNALRELIHRLDGRDRVAMVVYAGASGVVLGSTSMASPLKVASALSRLEAGGSTNGGAGIKAAYKIVRENYIKGGVNRVILATDGDFNVGTTSVSALVRLIREQAKSGVFLSVLGFGMGNYGDSTLEKLADKGNGNYAYIDSLNEARKALVDQAGGTLVTVAKDVKIQVEFNPMHVSGYRLVGYENRRLESEDFNDDRKDAGDMGAGHCVTALYELSPTGAPTATRSVDPLKYATAGTPTDAAKGNEWMTVKVRYKEPDGKESCLLTCTAQNGGEGPLSPDFRFAAGVASFALVLRGSEYRGNAICDSVMALVQKDMGNDPFGYRAEFVDLVHRARSIGRQ